MYLYKIGTQSDVLIKESVLISEGSFKKNSTVPFKTDCKQPKLWCYEVPML